ncbi:putative vacuolar amino acid transporter YPQ3 [Echria macrotheca]|uniref:Vacuolar amino acid transporter YPQ3 n=1 Tax=Echria macrotheca TaxID=438768 RepID=A0AAJ0BD53_9PEZI|nr:putative vacuolar amino acid transporter YPQ3 [Echria macrotheca]
MAPPTDQFPLDVEAISGICGSISIACWVVVFTPQIVENFRRSSAEGLSIRFIVVWLLGDVFNILGAVLQGVLPTMVILAFYYTLADIVLLAQCFYYRGFTLSDEPSTSSSEDGEEEPTKPLRRRRRNPIQREQQQQQRQEVPTERTRLLLDAGRHHHDEGEEGQQHPADWTHLSPAVPFVADSPPPPPPTRAQVVGFNVLAMVMVCLAGVAGWFLGRTYGDHPSTSPSDGGGDTEKEMNFWGQVFGWLCAALYLGSRLPQLLLNWRRKSTEGVSMLFFLFACLGNLTYVLSIVAYEPDCGEDGCPAGMYWRYMLVNLSWLAGSAGTLALDFAIFVQFFLYSKDEDEDDDDEEEGEEESVYGEERLRWDQRPVLERNQSDFV